MLPPQADGHSAPADDGLDAGAGASLELDGVDLAGVTMGGMDGHGEPETWGGDGEGGGVDGGEGGGGEGGGGGGRAMQSSRGFVEHVEADWAAFLAAVEGGGDGRAEANVLSKGVVSLVVSPRKEGTLWREAREAEKSSGVTPGDFVVGGGDADVGGGTERLEGGAGGDGGSVDEEAGEKVPKSLYGEPLLQSLLCSPDSPVEGEGYVGYEELEAQLRAMADRVDALPGAARGVFAESLTMDALPAILYLLVEAAETKQRGVSAAGRRLLRFMSEAGNPREVHVMVKLALGKVSERYLNDVCSLVIDQLLGVWGTIIPRIVGKRALFMRDVVDVLGRVGFGADQMADGTEEEDKEEVGKEGDEMLMRTQRGRNRDGPTARERTVLAFVRDLTAVQRRQMEATAVAVAGRDEGADDPALVPAALSADQGVSCLEERRQVADLRKIVDAQEALVHDFETERGATLATLLKLIEPMVCRLSPPQAAKPAGATVREADLVAFLESTLPLFEDLGFANAVDVCQQCMDMLSLGPYSAEDRFVAEVARPRLRRNRKAETFFSIKSIACYLMVALGCGKKDLEDGDALQASGFDALDPCYAVELALPYVMQLLSDTAAPLRLFGTQLLSALLQGVEAGTVDTHAAVLRTPYDMAFTQAEGSWYGLAFSLAKAVPQCDDPTQRAFMYDCLKSLLSKFSSPVRFGVVESLVLHADHHVMGGQLISELKDSMCAVDRDGRDSVAITKADVDGYFTRFVDNILPRFVLPRKEFLAGLQPATTACSAAYLIAIRDSTRWRRDDRNEELRARMLRLKDMLELAKQAMEANANVINIDVRRNNYTTLGKKADKPEVKEAAAKAERDLNACSTALAWIEPALERLKEVL